MLKLNLKNLQNIHNFSENNGNNIKNTMFQMETNDRYDYIDKNMNT
jgi:hypothetical protein